MNDNPDELSDIHTGGFNPGFRISYTDASRLTSKIGAPLFPSSSSFSLETHLFLYPPSPNSFWFQALSMIEGYDPGAVAKALQDFHHAIPNFHSNASLQAQLILAWDTDFASQVLNTWKPIRPCWIDVLGNAEDVNSVVQLMLPVLGPTDARAVVATAGDLYGGARRIAFMQALRLGLNQHRPPGLLPHEANVQNVCNPGPATGKEPPVIASNDPSSSRPRSTEKYPEDKIGPRSLDKRLPLASSGNLPSAQPQSNTKLGKGKIPLNLTTLATKISGPATVGASTTDASQAVHEHPPKTPTATYDRTNENSHPITDHKWAKPSARSNSSKPAARVSSKIPLLFAADDGQHVPTSAPKSTTKPVSHLSSQAILSEHGNSYNPSPFIPTQPHSPKDGTASESESQSGSEAETSAPRKRRNRRGRHSNQTTNIASLSTPKEGHDELQAPRGQDIQRERTPESSSPCEGDNTFGRSHRGAFGAKERDSHPAIDSFDHSEDEEREKSNDSEGDGSNYASSENDGASEAEGDEDEVNGGMDTRLPSPWDWDQEKNDELVELWGVEENIVRDPRSTAPVRAKWMYEARKGEMTDEQYSAKLQEEHRKFLAVPAACRSAVGKKWYKDSKLDWEIRVFLAPLVYRYALLKIAAEEAEALGDMEEFKKKEADRKALVTDAMAELMERFPDCSPNHELRRIKERFGQKELGKYVAKFRNKFTSDAGRMKTLYQKSEGKIENCGSKISLSTIMEILGRKRVRIAFQMWGASKDGGKEECDEDIEDGMQEWFEKNPNATALEASYHRIKVVQDVRKARFRDTVSNAEKEKWKKRAVSIHKPATPEEEQCFVEACLPYVIDLLKVLADRGNMHLVLLASSQGTGDIPIAIQEFSRKDVEQRVFLSAMDGLGARVRTDYVSYALERFGGGADDAVVRLATDVTYEFDDDAEEDESDPSAGETERKGNTQATVAPTFVPPFKPDLSETNTVPKMTKAISDYFVMAVKKLHQTRISWDNVTKYASKYIIPERMPMDPDVPGQRLQIQRPTAMSNTRIKAFFHFLVSSYDGSLPEHESFRFRLDSRYLNIPNPTAPANPEIHHAGAAAAKTKIPKHKRTGVQAKGKKTKQTSKKRDEVGDEGDYYNYEGLMQDADEAYFDDAVATFAGVAAQPKTSRKGKPLRIESPPQSPGQTIRPSFLPSVDLVDRESSRSVSGSKSLEGPPDKPVHRRKPRTKLKPKFEIQLGTDELWHPLILPDDAESAKSWMEAKQYLDSWGSNMTHCGERARKVPFVGRSEIKPSVDLPAALYSSVSILQLWTAFQRESTGNFDITFAQNLGLTTVIPKHHISKIISLIFDASKPLPSVKFVYNQAQISAQAAGALFLQIETKLSEFMDEVVASEESILTSRLNLLQGMRLASFMGATGFIRDAGEIGANTERTSALSDRFVQIVAAVAFARYMKLVLGRVAELYVEATSRGETKTMWTELLYLWNVGCSTLARPLVARRSDIFFSPPNNSPLPHSLQSLLDYAFNARPWWTPGPKGVPGPISLPNKQAVASDMFFEYLKGINWTSSTFLERGRILLLVFLGAIQVETGRVGPDEEQTENRRPAHLMSEALKSLRQVIEDSNENGPTEQPIHIPSGPITTWISKWEMECQVIAEDRLPQTASNIIPSPANPTLRVIDHSNDAGVASTSFNLVTQSDKMVEDGEGTGMIDYHEAVADPQLLPAPSTPEDTSRLPPEDEDPTFPTNFPRQPVAEDGLQRRSPSPTQGSLVPAIRSLDHAPLPPAKKRRTREVEMVSLDEADQNVRRLRSATVVKAAQPTLPTPPGTTSRTKPAGPSTSAAEKKRAATTTVKSRAGATSKPKGAIPSKRKTSTRGGN
ncbi:hypothetical protein M407DRAFT_22498 [Tulasnella calospora MUT 4182]|uniref:Uncharacterized protein n=1 Tax=Tulasnella calospora MUT 4182 TaxID=1051891 RepID=A0A0C3QMW8_9AGAM|nr:hypothetical protein M407DRAFT_22498 [Tulasnella calospora MUT 4182]